MTLVECFDRAVTQNIASCLHLRPDKLIFLGEAEEVKTELEHYRKFLSERGMNTVVQQRPVKMSRIESIAAVLREIVKQESACVIDVTGGDERLLMAVGYVLAGLTPEQRKRVAVQRFDAATGTAQDCDGDGRVVEGHPVKISVAELIRLHGGIVYPAASQPDRTWRPRDLEPLWKIMTRNAKEWNQYLSALELFESRADSKNQVFLYLPDIQDSIPEFEEKKQLVLELLKMFEEEGIIRNQSRGDILEYNYTNSLYRYCTMRVGNILEVKTLLEARAKLDGGKDYFQDCLMGVNIDWDGVPHPGKRVPETKNEIDVIATRGMIPLFISCKNGDVDEDELYKLHTVATFFGGSNAKMMLIASHLQKKSELSTDTFIRRAQDMGIYLVTDADTLSKEEWREVFSRPFGEGTK
jgi:hypothetical protein